MDIFKEFATDEKLELEGRWVDLGKGARILVARDGNENFRKELRKLLEQHAVTLDAGGDAADTLAMELMLQAKARTILVGFEGLSFKGKPLTYSPEAALELLKVKDFARLVDEHSRHLSGYKVKVEEALGNA